MVSVDVHQRFICGIPETETYDVVGIGPGIDTHNDTMLVLEQLLVSFKRPTVLDADALNILSAFPDLLEKLPAGSILTPHPGEFVRLAGPSHDDFDRLRKLKAFARDHQVYVVLKGYHSAIATPAGKVYFNTTGNPGMATGGSGDVLTGMIAGLLAQGYAPEAAAILGVFLHGLAGDIGVDTLGAEALIASDIIDYIPGAYKKLRSS
jgi:NAD(P)H-hydrate epimerase